MKLETIYNELKNNIDNIGGLTELLERLEKQIRLETSYKQTPKTRVNAIKRVASNRNDRPALTGYSIQNGYKIVTDSYQVVMIHQDEMPLPLVTTPEELKELGIDKEEYMNKYGRTSLLNFNYPNMRTFMEYSTDNEVQIDINDIEAFYKLHKKDNELYIINNTKYRPEYLKNIIDVLGSDIKCYYQGELRPLYIINSNNEIGMVMPCKAY